MKIVRKSADRWRYNLIGYKISWIFNKVWPRVFVFTWTDRDHNAPIFSTKRAYRNVVPCIAKTSQKHRTGRAKHQNKYITWKFNLSPTQWCKYHFNWISFKTQTFHLKVVSIDFSRILRREPCLPGLLIPMTLKITVKVIRHHWVSKWIKKIMMCHHTKF